jgi:hypothetical protein
MQKLFFLSALFVLVLGACEKEQGPKGDVNLVFNATWNGTPLQRYQYYPYDDIQVLWREFSFCISDIELTGNGDAQRLSEVEFLNFFPTNAGTNASQTIALNYSDKVKTGRYTGLKLGFGVKKELNTKRPADFGADHPLFNADYWSGWKSYIFSSTVGAADTNGDSNSGGDLDLVYHCGGDATYTTHTLPVTVDIAESGAVEIKIEVDLQKLFYQNGAWFDIRNTPQFSHGMSDINLMGALIAKYTGAVSVKN